MIRLTQEQGRNLLLVLLAIGSMQEAYDAVLDENGDMNWTDKERELRGDLLDTLILHDRESLIDDIVMQLKEMDGEGNVIGGDLIEVIARIAAAVGEAGCKPPTYSLVGDYFPEPKERTRETAARRFGM